MRADPLSYQLSGRVLIDAALEPAAVHAATRLLMARHDALRLRVDAQRPLQHLAPLGEAPVRVHDSLFTEAERAAWGEATHLPAPAESRLDAWVDQVLSEVLPLGDGPLFHLDLMPVGARRWELVWRCNHLIVDAISAWLMVRHWSEAYNAVLAGTPQAVGFGSSFVGSLSQDEAYAASPRAVSDRAYWRERFDEVPPPVFERQAAPSPRYVPACWVVEGPGLRGLARGVRARGRDRAAGAAGAAGPGRGHAPRSQRLHRRHGPAPAHPRDARGLWHAGRRAAGPLPLAGRPTRWPRLSRPCPANWSVTTAASGCPSMRSVARSAWPPQVTDACSM